MASGNEGIQQLLAAETEAAAIVEEARSYRKQKLKSAEQGAQAEVASFRAEIQKKFDQESTTDVGSTKSYQEELDRDTKSDLERMTKTFEKNSEKIVDLLAYHSTTVTMKVPDNIAQCIKATVALEAEN